MRYKELDSLRGIAALSVVMFHFTWGYDNALKNLDNNKFYFTYGYLGVHLFFLISGFVILMTLSKTKKTTDFAISRFSRLYPAYWAGIVMTVLITSLISSPFQQQYTIGQVLINFTMLQSLVKVKDVDSAYWTLSIELIFYCIMWIVFLVKGLRHIQWICFFWLILCLAFSLFPIPFSNYVRFILILKHAPLFIAGMLFYQLKKRESSFFSHLLILLSLFTEYTLLFELDQKPIVYVLVTFFYGLFYLFVFEKIKFLSNKILYFLGTISYSLYLIHQEIGMSIIYLLKKTIDKEWFYLPATISFVLLLASLLNIIIEKPAMRLIRGEHKPVAKFPVPSKVESG
jgi:peptidoglycan/LPS O-acetylase OafA/YrhL